MLHSLARRACVAVCLITCACSSSSNDPGFVAASAGASSNGGVGGSAGSLSAGSGGASAGASSGVGAGGAAAGQGAGGTSGASGASGGQAAQGGSAGSGGTAGSGSGGSGGAAGSGPFKVFMIASTAPEHKPMSDAAVPVIQGLGALNGFSVDATSDTSLMTDENLSHYQVFLQMQLGSFEMPPAAQAALQKFIEQGKGWVGVHAAGLTGIQFIEDKNGQIIGDLKYWPWYTTFVGGDAGLVWSIHPAEQQGTLKVEDRTYPTTKNLPASFQLKDEWYEWKENPRPNVHVLCTADESTYTPVNRQGDHPIVWTNPSYPHTIYIGVGHDAVSLKNTNYVTLLRDSILWAAGR